MRIRLAPGLFFLVTPLLMAQAPDPVAKAAAQYEAGDLNGAQQTMNNLVAAHPESAEARFQLGNLYARRKLYAEAAEAWKACLRIEPRFDEARVAMVKALLTLDRYDEALAALGGRQEDFDTRVLRGAALRGLGEDARALPDLDAAVRLRPSDYIAHYNFGFVLFRLERLSEAKAQFERALELRPESTEARYQLAMVLKKLNEGVRAEAELRDFDRQKKAGLQRTIAGTAIANANDLAAQGDAKGAAAQYKEAIRLDPGNADAYYDLALTQLRLGDTAAAEKALRKTIELNTGLAAARNQLGLLLLGQNKIPEARRELEAAGADLKCAECRNNLGVLFGQQGDLDRAEKLFRAALEIDPRFLDAKVNLGLILAGRDQFVEAEREFQAALALEPRNTKALTGLGMVQTKMGKPVAVDAFRTLTAIDPSSSQARLNLGIAYADTEKPEAALIEFTEAIRLAPTDAVAHYNKGRVLKDLGRLPEAADELAAASKLAPDYTAAVYAEAMVQQQLEHYPRAIELLRVVTAREPRNARAYFLLGQCLARSGKEAQAVAAWKSAVQSDPSDTESLYALFRALAKSNPAEASVYESRFAEIRKKNQQSSRAETLSNFAIAAAADQDWTKAVSQLKEAISLCGECASKPGLHKNLGLIECRSGDIENGERELRIALKDRPGDPEILRSLATIERMRTAVPPR